MWENPLAVYKYHTTIRSPRNESSRAVPQGETVDTPPRALDATLPLWNLPSHAEVIVAGTDPRKVTEEDFLVN